MTGFQTSVAYNPAPAVEGDFASSNPRKVVLAGPGGLVAGTQGLTVGRFAWLSYQFIDADEAPAVADNFGSGAPAGFVHREQQGLLTTYLQESGMLVPGGFPVTLFDSGDFWVKNSGAALAQVGMKAYANYADGKVTFAAASAPATASGSASSVAASTSSSTGSINDNILTLTAIGSGTIYPGTTISGTGVATGTKIVKQVLPLLSGEAVGGIGRYTVSIPEQSVASTTISGTYGTLTVGGTVAGTWGVGGSITGTGISVTTYVTALGTGTGGAGTYVVDVNTVVSSTAITLALNYETKWYARSAGIANELIKISDQPLG